MGAVSVACYDHHGRNSYRRVARAMCEGIERVGDRAQFVERFKRTDAAVGVMYGWKFRDVLRRHARFLYVDLGYWRREDYWRVAANDWNPLVAAPRGMPSDRLRALGVEVLPEHGGDYALVLGATRKSARDFGLRYMAWEERACRALLAAGARVLFRPKPTDRGAPRVAGTVWAGASPLAQLFAGASIVVAHHSNGCVEAVAAGCAVHCAVGAAAERSVPLDAWRAPPRLPGREQFLADVAYTQWTLAEMRSGAAWRHYRSSVVAS